MKTLKEKIAELDKKFEGFADGFNHLDRKIGKTHVSFRVKNILVVIDADYGKPCDISFDDWEDSAISFKQETLELAITKAHDYFIVKGGEL